MEKAASLIFNHSELNQIQLDRTVTCAASAKSAGDRQIHVSRHANDLRCVATVTFVQGVKRQSSSDVIILDRVFEFRPPDTYFMRRHVHSEDIVRCEAKTADLRP